MGPPGPRKLRARGASRTATRRRLMRASWAHDPVLVVDDHPVLARGWRRSCAPSRGSLRRTAGDGHELLAALRHTRPTVSSTGASATRTASRCARRCARTAPPEVVSTPPRPIPGSTTRPRPPAPTPCREERRHRRALRHIAARRTRRAPSGVARAEWRLPSLNGGNPPSNDRPADGKDIGGLSGRRTDPCRQPCLQDTARGDQEQDPRPARVDIDKGSLLCRMYFAREGGAPGSPPC